MGNWACGNHVNELENIKIMIKEKYQDQVESFVKQYIDKGYANAIYGNAINKKWEDDFKEKIYTLIQMAEFTFKSLKNPAKDENVVQFHISGNTKFSDRNGLVSFNFYYAKEGLKLGDLYVALETNGKRFPINALKDVPTVKEAITIVAKEVPENIRLRFKIDKGRRIK